MIINIYAPNISTTSISCNFITGHKRTDKFKYNNNGRLGN